MRGKCPKVHSRCATYERVDSGEHLLQSHFTPAQLGKIRTSMPLFLTTTGRQDLWKASRDIHMTGEHWVELATHICGSGRILIGVCDFQSLAAILRNFCIPVTGFEHNNEQIFFHEFIGTLRCARGNRSRLEAYRHHCQGCFAHAVRLKSYKHWLYC